MNQSYTFEKLENEMVGKTEDYQSILVILNTKSAVRVIPVAPYVGVWIEIPISL